MRYKDYQRERANETIYNWHTLRFLEQEKARADYEYWTEFELTPVKWLEVQPNAIYRRWL